MPDTFVEDVLEKAKLGAMLDNAEDTIQKLKKRIAGIADLNEFGKSAFFHELNGLEAGLKTHVAIYQAIKILNNHQI